MHDTNLLENQEVAWTPTPDVIERAQLTKFMRQIGVSTWDELYKYSINDVEKFTEEVLKFLDIKFDPPYEKLLDVSNGVEFPIWLSRSVPPAVAGGDFNADTTPPATAAGTNVAHAGLNITRMCLDRWLTDDDLLIELIGGDDEQILRDLPDYKAAVIWEAEDGNALSINYRELYTQVGMCAAGLLAHGLKSGDPICVHLPMCPEAVIGLLAINRIGAIAIPVFSGYGVEAISSRMNAVGAKAIITCKGFQRRGKFVNARETAFQAASLVRTIEKIFVVDGFGEGIKHEFIGSATGMINEAFERIEMFGKPDDLPKKVVSWPRLMVHGSIYNDYAKTSAEDPLIILYTSGTTGKPKGIAHTHASFPIKAAQDMAFGTDVGKGTRICWYTDLGWMMGPWLIYAALINGATICLYDGAPDYPTSDRMWEFCSKHRVEVLGISPTLVRALASREKSDSSPHVNVGSPETDATSGTPIPTTTDYKPPHQRHDLSSLRAFASTGEPWNPAPWWWLFENVGNSKLPIINYSGGTEISGGILMGNPLLAQKPCSFPAPCPGMDVDIFNEEGKPVGPNEVGELVIKQPWIGMARGFWRDKERYLETYWSRFEDTWVHGDWAMRDSDGHWFILGRSDDTLKVAGKRVGPAEVESLLVAHPLVAEAAVIGVPDEAKGTAMVAFCVLTDPQELSSAATSSEQESVPAHAYAFGADFRSELKALVAKDMGKPLAPSAICFVSALPKTRNAKVMRRVLRAAYLGDDPGDLSALENPAAVDEIKRCRDQRAV